MSVFDVAINTLFRDPNMAINVVYTPASGRAIPVRAIRQRPDIDSEIAPKAKLQQTSVTFEIRTSELASAENGDTIQDDSASYRVMNAQIKDPHRGVWTLEAAAI